MLLIENLPLIRLDARRLMASVGRLSFADKGLIIMEEANEIAERINNLLPRIKKGTLRFFGQWFGRPYDNVHTIESAGAKDNFLILIFNEKETLFVWNPSSFKINEDEFQIKFASRVFWQWYSYGNSQTPENLYYQDFVVEGDEIKAKTNVDWYKPNLQPKLSEPAVKIY